MRLRFVRPSSARSGPAARARPVLSPLAGLIGVCGLLIVFAWPALAGSQNDANATPIVRQGQRATPVPTTKASPVASPGAAGAALATPLASAVEEALLGVFSVGIGEVDLPPGLPGAPALVGLWNLSLEPDGTYTIARQDVGVVAGGAYSISGETLTFDDWSGVISCMDGNGDSGATYAWRLDEDVLTLTPIAESCRDRRILFGTRTLGSFDACVTAPMMLPSAPPAEPGASAVGEMVAPALSLTVAAQATPGATPVASADAVAMPADSQVEQAISALLRQATGCWATGDPARFLPLHGQAVLVDFIDFPNLISDLQLFMATPVSFELIGGVNMVGPSSAWAYVEITFGGEALPQRLDFVYEEGAWLLNTFFLFGPTDPAAAPIP